MSFNDIISNIKKQHLTIDNNQHLIYVGIGTAAYHYDMNNILISENYHQYPPFIQDLKNSLPSLNISIILIDSNQENPPYIVNDKGLLHNNLNDNYYYSKDNNLHVYVLRENIFSEPYTNKREDYTDITNGLRELNTFCINTGSALIYHDYTGRINRVIAEYFDEELKEHLDHIIYGLNIREETGCYFDLNSFGSYYPFYINEHNKLKLFNLYYYINNDSIDIMDYDIQTKYLTNHIYHCKLLDSTEHITNNKNIIETHKEKIVQLIKNEMNNTILLEIRIVFNFIVGKVVIENEDSIDNFLPSSGINRDIYRKFLIEKEYVELYCYLKEYFGKKLDIIAKVKNFDITGKEIIEHIILDDDPFKWYNNVKHFF